MMDQHEGSEQRRLSKLLSGVVVKVTVLISTI
jgi:hypothetical protein